MKDSIPTLSNLASGALLWEVLLACVCLLAFCRERSALGRILFLDFLNMQVVGVMLLATLRSQTPHFLDAAIVLTLLSFTGTLASVHYFLEEKLFGFVACPIILLAAMAAEPGTVDGDRLQPLAAGAAGGVMVAAMAVLTVGVIGVVRLPDLYSRVHAASKAGLMGVVLLVVSLGILGRWEILFRALLILGFLFAATPVSSHALLRAAVLSGEKMMEGSVDER